MNWCNNMAGLDYNSDKERGQGGIVYAVRNTQKGMPVKSIQTGRGELKLDKLGRCIVKDEKLAREIQQEHRHDLTVSRMFTNHPSDRGHTYFFGSIPALPWHKYDENGRRIWDTEPPEEAKSLQAEEPVEDYDQLGGA